MTRAPAAGASGTHGQGGGPEFARTPGGSNTPRQIAPVFYAAASGCELARGSVVGRPRGFREKKRIGSTVKISRNFRAKVAGGAK